MYGMVWYGIVQYWYWYGIRIHIDMVLVLVLVLEVRYATQFGFYAPRPNWLHIPEWLEEVSCNSR
jgi:hypothetical protein